MTRRLVLYVAVTAVVVASCGAPQPVRLMSSETTVSSSQSAAKDSNQTSGEIAAPQPQLGDVVVPDLEWTPLGSGTVSAELDVPLDYSDPDGKTITLYVVRHSARDEGGRIGSLLVNPGGPGFGGSVLAAFAPQIYDDALLDRFDIVGWDPRGTGLSTPAIDCIDDYDPFFAEIDITPETDEERRELVAVAQEFADRCVRTNEGVTEHAGTNNSARDMDVLRRALGEETISYFGFSYGSELGATWATLFPDTVRAAVLDGAADPNRRLRSRWRRGCRPPAPLPSLSGLGRGRLGIGAALRCAHCARQLGARRAGAPLGPSQQPSAPFAVGSHRPELGEAPPDGHSPRRA